MKATNWLSVYTVSGRERDVDFALSASVDQGQTPTLILRLHDKQVNRRLSVTMTLREGVELALRLRRILRGAERLLQIQQRGQGRNTTLTDEHVDGCRHSMQSWYIKGGALHCSDCDEGNRT